MTESSPVLSGDLDAACRRADEQLLLMAPEITEIRRHLHRHPELSGEEFETTAYLSTRLNREGVAHRLGPGGVGIITDIAAPGPAVALRADLDALPIREENTVNFCSTKPGIMHACGHDAHTAIVLAAVLALHRARAGIPWRGIFQSSEEAGHGALDLVRAGALDNVASILAFHVDPNAPVGTVAAIPGPQTAFCQDFRIEAHGRGGHAARPHHAVDPIAALAHLVTEFYKIFPRQPDPRDPVVVTVGHFSGGHCSNVIPDTAFLQGTIRTLSAVRADMARERIEHFCCEVTLSHGAKIMPAFDRLLPGVINNPRVALLCAEAATSLADKIVTEGPPSMGAEDFADYLATVPGCMMRLGMATPGKKITPLHTPTFDINENALLLGARILVRAAFGAAQDLTTCSSR